MDPEYKQYFQYFAEMPGYVTVQDRDFRIIVANKRFREDFGDFEGRYCYQVYKQRPDRCEVCPVARTFRDGQRHESQERVRTLSGADVKTIVYTKPIRDESGVINAVLEVSTDITHIQNLHELLSRSQQRYRLLFDEVPCYISIQDPQLNIIEANRAFQEAFGNSLGKKCYEAYKHRSEPCAPCPVQQTLDDGRSHSREECVTSQDGRQINTLVTTAPLKDGMGKITGVMEMSADITQIRELEDRLTSLGLLIGSVSHGLKGLLNGLAGGMYLVDTGMTKGDEGRIERGWKTVQRNVNRIRSMVSDILYYAKDRVPMLEPLSPVDIAEEVLASIENRAREQKVELLTEFDQDSGEFMADGQAIRALLMNLLENALDACRLDDKKSNHQVYFRLRGRPEHIEFEVGDNGIGMDRETRQKAFTLFFSSKGTGTGLGLFISDKIATAHGGSIALESTPDIGSRFMVQLPRKAPVEEAVAGESDPGADNTQSTER
ncbi:PAS domain-containing protein [Gemmatimonadota bacterium]